MNVFDIIGPVMIGPSSSHTAGAVRLGRVAWQILEDRPVKAVIELSGSFAQTYKGHGTDKALIAGIMGMDSYDERIRCSLELAREQGLEYEFHEVNIPDTHPNTAHIFLYGESGKTADIQGASVGGGNILVEKINEMDVAYTGQSTTILVRHYDRPGAIAAVTNFMAYSDVNIGNFRLSRQKKGGEAIMTIEIDGAAPEGLTAQLKVLPHVISAIILKVI